MAPFASKSRRAPVAILVLPLMFSSSYSAAQSSRYSVFEEPSVELSPAAGGLNVGPAMNAVGRDIQGSRFVGQDLRDAIFDGCGLADVRFVECDLSRASFKGARLGDATIQGCGLEAADFTDAIVNGLNGDLSEKQLVSTRSYKIKDLSWAAPLWRILKL